MSILKTPAALAKEAQQAHAAGAPVYAARIVLGPPDQGTTRSLDDVQQYVAAIEAQGWRLDQFSAAQGKRDWPQLYCIFRRA